MDNIYDITEKMQLFCTNAIEKERCDTFWTKEPETLSWIDSFKDGDVFFDVGANVGHYSVYAAAHNETIKVYSFEPVTLNFLNLVSNVVLNGLSNVNYYNIAIGRETKLDTLYLKDLTPGASGSQIDEPVDEYNVVFSPVGKVSVITYSLNDFYFMLGPLKVNHIKIDIDGKEADVLDGMGALLEFKELKSILIEVNKQMTDKGNLIDLMKEHGFTIDNPFNVQVEHSNNRRGGNPENIIFTRGANG